MRRVGSVAMSLVLAAVVGFAASQPPGSISGALTDTTGRALPGATLTAAAPKGAVRRTVTDAAGRYHFDSLMPGRYRIEASLAGFDTKESEMTVLAGRDAVWSGALLVGPALGATSIERQVRQVAGSDARDCGRHSTAATEVELQRSLTCALESARAREPFSVIVQFAGEASQSGSGLLAGSDGVIRVFQYEQGGIRLRSQPCPPAHVTLRARPAGTAFEFTCQAAAPMDVNVRG